MPRDMWISTVSSNFTRFNCLSIPTARFNGTGTSLASFWRRLRRWFFSFLPRGGAWPGCFLRFLTSPSVAGLAAAGAAGLAAAGVGDAGGAAPASAAGAVLSFGGLAFFGSFFAGCLSSAAGAAGAASGVSAAAADGFLAICLSLHGDSHATGRALHDAHGMIQVAGSQILEFLLRNLLNLDRTDFESLVFAAAFGLLLGGD